MAKRYNKSKGRDVAMGVAELEAGEKTDGSPLAPEIFPFNTSVGSCTCIINFAH